jgi:hypothetical protein
MESLRDESFTSPTFSFFFFPFRDCSKRVEFVVLGVGEGYRPFGDWSGTFFHRRRSRLLKTGFLQAGKRAENRKEKNPAVLYVRFEFLRKRA